jgi:S-adenosylmethionine:tRNA ribosyltransferase-isomerase
MHAEFIDVTLSTIERILLNLDKTIVAVGTTSLRTIESLYWLGVKVNSYDESVNNLAFGISLSQWEVYDDLPQHVTAVEALVTLTNWMKQQSMDRLVAKTQILIAPGYKARIANGLITNFHQPNSTLLLLVAALVGSDWKKVYDFALKNNYRFLSYGDGCLLWIR